MGVFDFVKDVGAKVGIGKSSDDKEAEAARTAAREAGAAKTAELAKAAADRAAKATADKQAATIAEKAKEALTAQKADKASEKLHAKATERFAEYKKSAELEKYVSDLGIDMAGIDIRFDDGTAYIEGQAADQATKEKIILAVGNAQGVGKVDEELTVAQAAEAAVFHTVVSGDTLWAIAQKVYGDGGRYPEIFEANKPMLTNPDLIYPGQVLRCPK
jgi:nucleoid-associated protein YgaU